MLFTTNLFNVTANDACKKAASRLATIDNALFAVGTYIVFAAGEGIPMYDKDGKLVGTAKVEGKPMSGKDIAAAIDKSPAYVSRMLKAMRAIIKAGDYTLFNEGVLKFQMDKVIDFYDNRDEGDIFEGKTAADVLGMTQSEIDAALKRDNEDADEDAADEDAAADGVNMVTFTYNGTEYTFEASIVYNALVAADIIK